MSVIFCSESSCRLVNISFDSSNNAIGILNDNARKTEMFCSIPELYIHWVYTIFEFVIISMFI